jgi:glycerol-3-phosphate dehydrogenase
MRRNLARLADEAFDLLIIGGGATGACVARDASLRGLRVALVERGDFAAATSAHNSKLVHGGLRYLRNLELRLVRESLSERRIWQRIAPHLVQPLPFLLPLYGQDWRSRATLGAGLTLYDALAFDRGWLDDPAQRLPGHTWLNRRAAIEREPVLDQADLAGAFLYYDAQMYSPERLALECLLDAASNGAAIANYLEAQSLLLRNGRCLGASVCCAESGEHFDVRAKATLVATGPWADLFLSRALGMSSSHKLLRSKGIHLLVPALTRGDALTVAAEGGHFFVLPWRDHTLLGTTDTAFKDDPDTLAVSDRDITTFLAFIARHLPQAGLEPSRVEYFYAGLRPLVDDGSSDTYGASRRSELVDHAAEDRIDGLFSAIGGKWTTSRKLAQSVVDTIARKLDIRPAARSMTAARKLPGANFRFFSEFAATQSAKNPLPAIHNLCRLYGSRVDQLLAVADGKKELLDPMGANGDIGAQVLFAVRQEMALTLSDVVMRRTGIGQFGPPPPAVLEHASGLMADELGWTEQRRRAEIESLTPWFETREAA